MPPDGAAGIMNLLNQFRIQNSRDSYNDVGPHGVRMSEKQSGSCGNVRKSEFPAYSVSIIRINGSVTMTPAVRLASAGPDADYALVWDQSRSGADDPGEALRWTGRICKK